MDRQSGAFRLTAWLTATSILAAVCLTGAPARAQDPGAAPGSDPPARVGRLSRLQGDVSTHGPDATQWTPAVLNFPFVSGDALWTQPQAQADIEIGPSLATLADRTELDLATLDDESLVASEPQGAVFLDLRHVRAGETWTINTPRGAVQIAADGEYEILAGDADTPTRVAVVRGAAQFTSGSLALRAGQGQMAVATGDQQVQGDVEPLTSYDPFLTAMLARNSVPITVPQVAQGMTGAEDLGQYGSWETSPDYGQVWYPQVAPDWVPYRDGSWSYVAPWGWTWVDNEPWGFAPFHYGRWAQIRRRWCWVPGDRGAPVEADPVYAPALVDFLVGGAVAGVAAGLIASSLASGRGDIGWVPLGPREAYSPPYGGSSRYLRRLNWGNGWHHPHWDEDQEHNRTTVINNTTRNVFINRGALTVAPAAAILRSQQIRPLAHDPDSPAARAFQSAAVPLRGTLPIRPAAETRGLTPRTAQQLGLPGSPAHPPAPGPAIHPATMHPAILPGGRFPAAAAPGPDIRHGPLPPRPPLHPATPVLPLPGPGQPAVPERARLQAQPRTAIPRGPELPVSHPATLPRPAPAQPPQRIELSRPEPPRPGMRTPGMPRSAMPSPVVPGAVVPGPVVPGPVIPSPVIPRPVEPRPAPPRPPQRVEPPRPEPPRPSVPTPSMPRPAVASPVMPRPAMPRPAMPSPAMPRPVEPRIAPPPAFHPEAPRPMMMPRMAPQRPMAAPQFQAPRPMAAPHAAPPPGPRPAGHP